MTPSSPTLTDGVSPADVAAPPKVLLIGMMGAGKSLAANLAASRLDWPFLDTDHEIQARTGQTVAEIFADRGEAAFRAEEAQTLAEAMNREGPLVVSVAGGAVLSPDNRRLLRRGGVIIWLRAELATLARRVVGSDHRPLLEGDRMSRLTALYGERGPYYQELADVVIDVDALSPGEVADQVVAAFQAACATRTGPRGGGGDA
jgi:shikimate kinase